MLRQVVFETIGPDGYMLLGTEETETAIEQLVLKAMRDDSKAETDELVREMLDDGSIVMTVDNDSVKIEKADA